MKCPLLEIVNGDLRVAVAIRTGQLRGRCICTEIASSLYAEIGGDFVRLCCSPVGAGTAKARFLGACCENSLGELISGD